MQRSDKTRTLAAVLLAMALVATAGCGYRSQLSGSDSNLSYTASGRPAKQTRIAVLALRNDSPEPWLDRIVTDAVRREISARAAFSFVNDPDRADLVLRGRIRPPGFRSKSFSRFVAALEYGLTLQLDLELLLAGGNVVRLDSKMLSESDVYLASADIEVTRTNRLEAFRRLSDLLASRVADSIELLENPIPEIKEGEGG